MSQPFPFPDDAGPRDVAIVTFHLHFGIKDPKKIARTLRYESPSHVYAVLKEYRKIIDYTKVYDFTL